MCAQTAAEMTLRALLPGSEARGEFARQSNFLRSARRVSVDHRLFQDPIANEQVRARA